MVRYPYEDDLTPTVLRVNGGYHQSVSHQGTTLTVSSGGYKSRIVQKKNPFVYH